MKLDIATVVNQLHTCSNLWSQISQHLPPNENLQGLGVSCNDIGVALKEVSFLASAMHEQEVDAIAWCVQKQNIESTANALIQFLNSAQSNPQHASSNANQICHWIFSIRGSFSHIALIPLAEHNLDSFSPVRMSKAKDWIDRAEDLKSEILRIHESAATSIQEISVLQSNAVSAHENILSSLSVSQGYERDAGNARTNAVSSATVASSEAASVSKLVEDISLSVERKNDLFREFESRRSEIADLLENANKVGLARSFSDKSAELTWTWRGWAIAFLAGIAGLLWIGVYELLPLLRIGSPDPVAVVLRFLIASPLVWFTWFSARQYGHVLRITEDYSFKAAAAMAYVGYRNEMGADQDMLNLLKESAIRNFGSNPAEMLLQRADPASPLHEMMERTLAKLEPKDILEALSKIAPLKK